MKNDLEFECPGCKSITVLKDAVDLDHNMIVQCSNGRCCNRYDLEYLRSIGNVWPWKDAN